MTGELSQVRRQKVEIERLATIHGARNIRIFGSVARGKAGPASDVDILAAFTADRSLLDLIGFQQELEDVLGCEVDVVSEGALRPNDRILRETVAL